VTRKREVLVGAAVVAGVLVSVLGTLWLQGMSLTRTTRLEDALFTDVGQLMDGNSVKYRGVTIGRVSAISVEPDGQAVRVTMRVGTDLAFPADAAAVSSPESMFGDWQIEIVSLRDHLTYAFYQDGLNGIPGYALPDISELTAQAEVIADNITELTDRVKTAFTPETAENLARAIDNIQQVSERIALLVDQQAETFTLMTEELHVAAGQVGDAAGAVEATFSRVDTLLGDAGVDSLVMDIRGAASNLRVASEELTTTARGLQSTLSRADSTFATVNRIASRIEAGEGGLGRLVGDSALVLRAEGALAQLNLLLEDLRENPNRYFRLSIF